MFVINSLDLLQVIHKYSTKNDLDKKINSDKKYPLKVCENGMFSVRLIHTFIRCFFFIHFPSSFSWCGSQWQQAEKVSPDSSTFVLHHYSHNNKREKKYN